jgi:hypothetical protein
MYCLSQPSGQPAVISKSTDYGVTWNTTGGVTNSFFSITTNRTGQYVIIGAMNSSEALNSPYLNQVWRSSDYGVTFSRVKFSNFVSGILYEYPQLAIDVTVDSSGNRQYASSVSLSIGPLSAQVGKTTSASSIFDTPYGANNTQTFTAVSTSVDGSKVVVANQGGYYGYNPGSVQMIRSIDYGDTYANFGGVSKKWYDVTIDGSGTNIIAVASGTDTLYKSVSFGTLSAVGSSKAWVGTSISYNATVAIASETTGLWRSTNGGSTWTKLS